MGAKLQKGGYAMKQAITVIAMMTVILCLAVPGVLRADDTDIYGCVRVDVDPNVLIIFDTSRSMDAADVYTYDQPYDPSTTYEGSYVTNGVYIHSVDMEIDAWRAWPVNRDTLVPKAVAPLDVNEIGCEIYKETLLTKGWAARAQEQFVSWDDYRCASNKDYPDIKYHELALGNFLNYQEIMGSFRTRIDVAKEVIIQLINATEKVRFGLMRFNDNNQGGRIIAECGSDKTTLINTINSLVAGGYTPLAETLAEAGLYFAGMNSWYNDGVTYTSPMQYRCQKNYIIIMTDGEPTEVTDSRLTSGTYINNNTIGSNYLDDVAKYLYENDCNPTLGTGTDFEKQNIVTYTIGFKTQDQLLQDTAFNGGGQYFPANNTSELSAAFGEIIHATRESNVVFVSPVVPISSMNRSYAGNYLYLGLFKPMPSGRWRGNIKKYGLGPDGEILDVDGLEATTPDGKIKDNARSYWSSGYPDGPDVDEGGAGEVLLNQTTRNLYTYMGSQNSLIDLDNQFSMDHITNDDLHVSSDTERENVINEVYGEVGERWRLGDILHSQPIVVHYDTNGDKVLDASFIFAGSNDGMMHCFDDSDGSEVWGFIPPDQLPRLSLLLNSNHDYFVDGSPVVYQAEGQKILFFGERRGGDHYYALDVATAASPTWLYKIEPNILGGGDAQLGQSWCKPEIHKVKTGNEADPEHTVFLLAGGYDNTNQDRASPAATDSVGRAVFTVKVSDGTVSTLDFNAANYPAMTHSIVEVSGFDTDADEFMNRAYAGDLGGHMFAFEDDDGDGTWSVRKLFSASTVDGVQRKIFYAPDAVEEPFGELIFFGTGDRADPRETGVENRFYVVKNEWVASESSTTLSESDLVDVTGDLIQLGTAEQKAQVQRALETSKGWYIRLENPGEKVTASPTVFGGVVYFTTYTPSPEGTIVNPNDPCEAPTASGVARLYAVDYLTGAAVLDYSPTVEIDRETGRAAKLGKLDRSKVIGWGIPSAPVVAVLESGAKIFLGVEGGVVQETPVAKTDMNIFYWRQIFF
jgi:type IV pilus assembly protein PilY1